MIVAGGLEADAVGRFHDLQPLLGIDLVGADYLSDVIV
jgi:hypothetical protein